MNDVNYKALENSIREWYENTDENIVSVGYSNKISNNITTEVPSIRFSVKTKKAVDELSPSEILPKTININGTEYQTDVVQQSMDISINACYSWEPPDQTIMQHRGLVKPLRGGVSIGTPGEISAGTMGSICLDKIDNTIIGLTNNHVVLNNGFLNSSRTQLNPNSNIFNTKYVSPSLSEMVQPGRLDSIATQRIGPIKRYYPLSTSEPNYIDAAIIAITSPDLIDNKSFEQMNNSTNYAPVFATTEEINSLLANPKPILYKSGRTTGFIGGPSCPLEAISLIETLSVGGYSPYNASVTFSDLIVYKYSQNNSLGRPMGGASIPGDSGSVVLANFNGVLKIVGLNFAGGSFASGDPTGNAGVACRIDRVAQELFIDSWNASSMNFSKISDWTYYQDDQSLSSNSRTIQINNDTYWQIGTI